MYEGKVPASVDIIGIPRGKSRKVTGDSEQNFGKLPELTLAQAHNIPRKILEWLDMTFSKFPFPFPFASQHACIQAMLLILSSVGGTAIAAAVTVISIKPI